MLDQPIFRITDGAQVRTLIDNQPWATLISATDRGLCVSHLPVLLDPTGADIGVVGHLARADANEHELGEREVVVVIEGPNGYLSPSWYGEQPHVPTWNFVVAHLHGRPERLNAEQTYQVLSDTVDHLEAPLVEPWSLDRVADYAERIARATVGFRLRPSRVVAKAKLSQDESAALITRSVTALRADHAYRNVALADAMERTLDRRHE
jgi:transcriptional regulator